MARKKKSQKRIRERPGDVVSIPLGDGTFGYGRVLPKGLTAFYDLRSEGILPLERILSASVAFITSVMEYAVTRGIWPVIGNAPLPKDLLEEPLFFKKDPITGALRIYRDSTQEEFPATREQCEKLECAAVWDPEHIVDRLKDHFAGRPNIWVESMRP
jgi:hypothetical protein